MTTKHIITLSGIIIMTLLMPACRTSKHTTATSTSTTSITQNAIDSAAHRLMASQSRRLTITYIPSFQITTPDLPIPRTTNPLQDLTNQLIEQGGGTLIIEEETAQTHHQPGRNHRHNTHIAARHNHHTKHPIPRKANPATPRITHPGPPNNPNNSGHNLHHSIEVGNPPNTHRLNTNINP